MSGPLPGAVHDLTAVRIQGSCANWLPPVTSCWRTRDTPGPVSMSRSPAGAGASPPSQKGANRAHARLRSPGERANAQLKTWRILRKLRCCPWRAGQLAKAIHVLQAREIGG
jgi:hypothetical protein